MLSASLFLGLQVNPSLTSHLSSINPEILRYFVQREGNYLVEVSYFDELYLGKYIEGTANFAQLELLEAHIFSLIKKIVPHYPCDQESLVLFPIMR